MSEEVVTWNLAAFREQQSMMDCKALVVSIVPFMPSTMRLIQI